jgi:hypothetical protein
MNAAQWLDLVVALSRLIFFLLESKQARRSNDES